MRLVLAFVLLRSEKRNPNNPIQGINHVERAVNGFIKVKLERSAGSELTQVVVSLTLKTFVDIKGPCVAPQKVVYACYIESLQTLPYVIPMLGPKLRIAWQTSRNLGTFAVLFQNFSTWSQTIAAIWAQYSVSGNTWFVGTSNLIEAIKIDNRIFDLQNRFQISRCG